MKQRTKTMWLLTVMMYLIIILNTYNHELTHQRIAREHGCVEDRLVINPLGFGYHQCLDYVERSTEERLDERNLHSMNEIVGYNLSTLLGTVYLLGVILIITVMKNQEEAKKE